MTYDSSLLGQLLPILKSINRITITARDGARNAGIIALLMAYL
jgi:hypothetical protein